MGNTSYGDAYARRHGLRDAVPAVVSRMLHASDVAVIELGAEVPTFELSEPPPVEDAFLISAIIIDSPAYTLWEDGRPVQVDPLRAGDTEIFDLRTTPVVHINSAHHALHFYFPRTALNAIADSAGVQRIAELRRAPSRDDCVVRSLAAVMLPAMRQPSQVTRLFVEHLTLAIGTHAAQTYGGMGVLLPVRGGLAGWQERRVADILEAHLDGDIPLGRLAQECGLSPSHFARAFRRSFGAAPHQWLMRRRVERARELLRIPGRSLSDIALACGFSDQSHFTRVFRGHVGTSPGAWRRDVLE